MRSSLIRLAVTVPLLGTSAAAQMCAPLLPSGQPGLPFLPVCVGAVAPAVVWAAGNPAFALSAAPFPIPALPPGLPTFLVIGVPIPPPTPVPPVLLHPAFGFPGLLASPIGLVLAIVPSGPSGPAPGPPIAFPIPPTGGPLGLAASVHTIVLVPAAVLAPGGVGLTSAIGITI
jgi:hypothetical protein